MHVSNKVSPALLAHLFKMVADGAILEADIKAFVQEPYRWRQPIEAPRQSEEQHDVTCDNRDNAASKLPMQYTPANAQAFWQSVYDELGIKVTVPPAPKLTKKQTRSLDRFGFMLVYIPGVTEEQYPVCFVKPNWGQYLTVSSIERIPLVGAWVTVETIAKPNYDDTNGYPNDRLILALHRATRFNTSHDDLTGGLMAEIAKVTGFPQKKTRLPTVEEWNLIGNLFNWLREHRQMNLPELGSTRSWEWCQNVYVSDRRLIVGGSESCGLAGVHGGWHGCRHGDVGFRVLAVL